MVEGHLNEKSIEKLCLNLTLKNIGFKNYCKDETLHFIEVDSTGRRPLVALPGFNHVGVARESEGFARDLTARNVKVNTLKRLVSVKHNCGGIHDKNLLN